jgi:uncharacterized protein (TIGR02996 family)
MAELARGKATIQLERGGAVLVEYAPPSPLRKIDYPNERAALAIFRKRVVELVKEHWHLRIADTDIGGAVASDPAIEAAILASTDPDQLAVYADWLLERGDPCGELAALRSRLDERSEATRGGDPTGFAGGAGGSAPRGIDPALRPAIASLEAARGYELFGSFADLIVALPEHRDTVALLWSHGWIEGLELARTQIGTLVAFALHGPMARFVRRLVVRRDVYIPAVCYALRSSPRRTAIRRLEVADPDDAAELLAVLPGLDEVTLAAGASTGDGHDRVHTATVIVDRPCDHLMIGRWPALETLTVRSTVRPALLGRLLAALPRQRFTHQLSALRIDGEVDAAMLAKLAEQLPSFQIATDPENELAATPRTG